MDYFLFYGIFPNRKFVNLIGGKKQSLSPKNFMLRILLRCTYARLKQLKFMLTLCILTPADFLLKIDSLDSIEDLRITALWT